MDTQITEIVGRNRLINELLTAGLEVATPIRDRGIDLIAYLDIDDEISRFVAFPIQLKVSTTRRFSIMRKYNRFPNLILAYVWGISEGIDAVTYALTQSEAVGVANVMGYTKTSSWLDSGEYSVEVRGNSGKLYMLLEPYRMTETSWRVKLETML